MYVRKVNGDDRSGAQADAHEKGSGDGEPQGPWLSIQAQQIGEAGS